MTNMTEEVVSYKCNWCNKLHKSEVDADKCALEHAKENLANSLLNNGYPLSSINYFCGFNWSLTKKQESITKYNCFVISHWQCCDKPAYRIVRINERGYLMLRGKGNWSGYYGDWVKIDRLPVAHSKDELFVDRR
jgi:hypothetical protein